MERLLLCWDDLDDLVGAVGFLTGAFTRWLLRVLKLTLLASSALAMVVAGAYVPPLGLAFATLLFVSLLYHRVTEPPVRPARAA